MFETGSVTTTAAVEALLSVLSRVDSDVTDGERMDQLSALEAVKAAAAAAQARITADFVDSQEQVAAAWRQRAGECADINDFDGWRAAREQERRATLTLPGDVGGSAASSGDDGHGRRRARRSRRPGEGLGVAGQVALARRESPSRGAAHVATAVALVRRMPRTLAALEAGVLSEWRASLLVRETAMLTDEQRTAVDSELFDTMEARGDDIGMLGDRELVRRVQAISYRVDAESALARCRGAESQRRVTIRPAPDTMAYVTAFLPVAQGVAVHAALTAAAASARAAGDERSKGQLMADTFVARLTGQETADVVPVEVQVVMTDRALLAGDDTPAHVPGYGAVPAGWARDLITKPAHVAAQTRPDGADADRDDVPDQGGDAGARVWMRRLYTSPDDGTLVAMDSVRRVFDGGLRRYLIARDGTCRTPWCDAPIRHLDHVADHATGGRTNAENGQGLCVRCNHTKQLPGWRADVISKPWLVPSPSAPPGAPPGDGHAHTVETTTPTGHAYRSTAPPVLPGQPLDDGSPLERHLERLLAS